MSTFKVQPVYAELLLGWLDAASLEVGLMETRSILSRVAWTFHGGKMGEYSMGFPTETSETRFPDGNTEHLSTSSPEDPNLLALELVTRTRVKDKRMRSRGCADWAASHALMCATWDLGGQFSQVRTGMSAVYHVLRYIWENCAVPTRSGSFRAMMSFVRETTLASSAASNLDIPTTSEILANVASALSHTRLPALRHAAAEFASLMRYSGSREARTRSVRLGKSIISDPAAYEGLSATEIGAVGFVVAGRKFMSLHGCAACVLDGVPLILSRSDILRVHQFLTGAQSGLFATVTQACVAPGPERSRATEIGRTYEAQVARLLEGSRSVPVGMEVSLCKSFKRAFGAFLGELAGPLCRGETAELWDEALGTTGAQALDLHGWVGSLRSWTASTAFNLGKVYKLCPAPDACPGQTMLERHEMVCNHNTMNPNAELEFESELKCQVLRAYIRKPGVRLEARGKLPTWWAAYRAQRFDEVPSREIDEYLAWEGTAAMPPRTPDNPAVWKDSGLGWDTYEDAIDPDRDRKNGNMLMRMVFDTTAAMPGVEHSGHSHDQKVDIKPEGHKDPARGIYSGNLKDRLNQSWMEAAVHSVCVHHPSFMIGANVEARDARVREIVSKTHDPEMVALYYSFDIKGWSPRMPPRPQHISHSVWASLYDCKLFREAHLITDSSRVYMNKGGYRAWFINPGVNFEGYNGKEMTMLLITMMSMAVRRWRTKLTRLRLATDREARAWSAVLLAYIDDGLARMVLPQSRASELFRLFQDTSVETFSDCGFTIEPSKCYPSDRFAIFLNEPYLGGRHVVHGTRAAMTICAENTEEHTSLVERVTAVSTGCRGAVMSGLDATAGVMLQSYHVYANVSEWVRKPDPVIAALWSVLPRAWGGLGMPTALQLGTSGSGSAFEESLRTVQAWAQISSPARLAFLRRARGTLVGRGQTGILLAPLGGRAADGTMVESRVPDAVRESLTRLRSAGRLSRLATDFLAYSSPESLEAFACAVVPLQKGAVIQEQLLHDLASAHPHAIFSSFARRIEKSATLMQLVGTRTIHRIIRANRDDASRSYACIKALITV